MNHKENLIDFENILTISIEHNSMIFLSYLWHSKHIYENPKIVKFKHNNFTNKVASRSFFKNMSKSSLYKSNISEMDEENIPFKKLFDKIDLLKIIENLHKTNKKNNIM